jgi:hypothetical protein
LKAGEGVMHLTVVLRRTDPAGFAAYLNALYDPRSSYYRKFATQAQLADRFGPGADDVALVRGWFERRGLGVGDAPANRLTLDVSGPRAAIEQALAVRIDDYKLGTRTFHANDRDPSLPRDVAARVEAVVGLSDLATPVARPQPMLDHLPDNQFNRALWYALCANYAVNGDISAATGELALFELLFFPELEVFVLLNALVDIAQASDLSSQGTGAQYAKCVNQYNKKYGYSLIGGGDPPPPAWQGATGAGQTIGLLEFDTFQASDVANYVALMGQASGPASNVTQVHVNGGASLGASQDEVLLDIADVLTAAPDAKIVVFDAPGSASYQAMFNTMINAGVNIISNSWAYCEDQTTLADVQSIDTILQSAAAAGISVFTGAGDHGSTCLDGSPNTAAVPATSPHITAVGGTSLREWPGFTYGTETWWDSSGDSPPGGQGGFGTSRFFTRPAYQDGVTGATMRSIPDVSANADPHYGVMICQASAGGCPTYALYGGTSSSAPTWAAFAALLNQTQGSNLGFLNPLVYPFADTNAFHNAVSMGSDFAHVGLGSPNLARLHQKLTGQATGPASASVSTVKAVAQTTLSLTEGATLPLPSYADGTTQTFVVVTLVDDNGIPVGGKTIALSANVGSSATIAPATAKSNPDTGVALFKVTDTAIETVTITATDTTDGITLQAHPRIGFMSPPASAGGIAASPDTVASDGTSTTTITVTLQNSQGQGARNKLVTLSQGTGHSVITGPVPALTDASGQVTFTATNGVSETVVYTAVDVTDDNMPVPGSASVSFTGGSTSCVGAPPVAAAGFAITPWANGFVAQNFFFGNVNWGGCPGVSNPTFSPSGSVFAADFRTGDLFRFGLDGGAAAGHTLSNLGQTLGEPTYGKDGRLYATHSATTGNFFTGDLVELDPSTGAQLRVVASNLTCAGGLVVDPLSGDLFFDDACTGAGSDNASIWRVHDPAGGTPTMSVYATLPATPNGGLAFSPDGTLYAVTGYFNNPAAPIIRITGTDKPQPPTQTTVSGITTDFGVAIAEATASGAVKTFMVHQNGALVLVDAATLASTTLATGTISPAVIGPDGCLYAGAGDTIYKLSPASGGCDFLPTNPAPALALSPASVSPNPQQGATQSFTATFRNVTVPAGTAVTFTISGANARYLVAATDASGAATISYTGVLAGTDTVTAKGGAGASRLTSNAARVTWDSGRHVTFLGLGTSPSSGSAGHAVTLSASLSDATQNPLAMIPGATIHFSLGAQGCDGVTNGSGVATCTITPSSPGQLVLTASYAGSSTFTPASASERFSVLAAAGAGSPPGAPTIGSATAGNGQVVVSFAAPSDDGGSPITGYVVACTPSAGGSATTASGVASPIVVHGLTNGVTYSCTVAASNAAGTGPASASSNAVTPFAAAPPPLPTQPIPTLDARALLLLIAGLALVAMAGIRSRKG